MSYYSPPQQPAYGAQQQPNLQFYQSTYPAPVSGHTTPSQAQYGGSAYSQASAPYSSFNAAPGFGASSAYGAAGVSGRMGEQGGLRTGWLAAFGTEGYDGEPPLLEELGVNFGHIKGKTLTVLSPLSPIPPHIMDDSDLAGPILFFLLFGTFLLFSGKVHFGYIYGLALVGSLSLHTIFSLMSPAPNSIHDVDSPAASSYAQSYNPSAPPSSVSDPTHGHGGGVGVSSSSLTFPRSASVLGYCLLPLVLVGLVGVVMPLDSLVGYVLSTVAIGWCTYSSSKMFCAVGRMRSMRPLVAYPLGLFYVGFGIMGIFSSTGAGGGVKS